MNAPVAYLTIPPFPGARARPLGIWAPSDEPFDRSRSGELARRAFAAGLPEISLQEFVARAVEGWRYASPFTGQPIRVEEAIDLCGFWLRLIEQNRKIDAAMGFAFWKRDSAAPMLWSGRKLPFVRKPEDVPPLATVAIWRSRVSPPLVRKLEERGCTLVEVEDGFIRSSGLGADCVPPLSLVVDQVGVHFDPSRPSELEQLIEHGRPAAGQIARAAALRRLIIQNGLTKYESDRSFVRPQRRNNRSLILVPGQVEDDRSVLVGGGDVRTNLELLRRVRALNPEAHIIYKPHPDVEAGHRPGVLPDALCLEFANEIVPGAPISGLIDAVDEVHVITSLAGFEALLRGKLVTAHGVPFYAGWGLTRDLGTVPTRRTARPTIDQLVAAVLLEYPRYFDPIARLPCPAEVVVERLISGRLSSPGLIVGLRRAQGRIMRRVRKIVR